MWIYWLTHLVRISCKFCCDSSNSSYSCFVCRVSAQRTYHSAGCWCGCKVTLTISTALRWTLTSTCSWRNLRSNGVDCVVLTVRKNSCTVPLSKLTWSSVSCLCCRTQTHYWLLWMLCSFSLSFLLIPISLMKNHFPTEIFTHFCQLETSTINLKHWHRVRNICFQFAFRHFLEICLQIKNESCLKLQPNTPVCESYRAASL